ncbi:MAG: hypothetical protein E6Q98_05805 [Rhodospirillaceae bacterium]|nr:MAG: hypothetical protein E6Q98_05805 [Rhodospirillaceae bacterium]
MTLARLGSFHQSRLSFLRSLLRRAARENWTYERRLWQVDDKGEGVAVYRVGTAKRAYSLVCFPHDLPPEKRSDRVIADEWDATFVLYDGDIDAGGIDAGEIDAGEIARLQANAPGQEAGRYGPRDLVLSRANRSVRLFDYAVTCLATGKQPEAAQLAEIGYLMRTTAVYGNGKFGLADRCSIADRPELAGPFQAEMLTVWLIRWFTIDIVEHMARQRAPETAVPLAADLRRVLGVGNATGLGMAPFLVLHSALIDRWIDARETALARIRSLPAARDDTRDCFLDHLGRAQKFAADWRVEDKVQQERILGLREDLRDLRETVADFDWNQPAPWDRLIRWSEAHLRLEAQEMLVTLVLEPHGELIDDLTEQMGVDETAEFKLDGTMPMAGLRHLIETHYSFALGEDYRAAASQARFWYVSAEKLEPRLGERFEEAGGELEQPLGIARDVKALYDLAATVPADQSLAAFLRDQPELRHIARRVQITARHPYAEIRGNLLAADMRPIDLLRCKLAFFGATRFDPKSDRWLRITLFQHAPFPEEIDMASADNWAPPPVEVRPGEKR